jgi:hypothetical protein
VAQLLWDGRGRLSSFVLSFSLLVVLGLFGEKLSGIYGILFMPFPRSLSALEG